MKICVIIRVYNRLTDLEKCLEIIKKYWTRNDYNIIIVSNGRADGFAVPNVCRHLADLTLELDTNSGHLCGNSQLLTAGIDHIPNDCPYTILLEADTWLFSDSIISRYIKIMETKQAVWASAEWLEKYYSLALDFAIVKSDFIINNPQLLRFSKHAESHVCNYLLQKNQLFIYILEAMPVHFPKLLRHFYNPSKGRMRSFSRVPMVTHHIEELAEGLEEKCLIANLTAGRIIFQITNKEIIIISLFRLKFLETLIKICPRSSWIKKKKIRKL